MKALTFKKTAVAAALLTVSGVASAANVLIVTDGDTPANLLAETVKTSPQSDAKLVVATERATDNAFEIAGDVTPTTSGGNAYESGKLVAYKADSFAPQNGNLIKLNFTNGGLEGNSKSYKIAFSNINSSGNFADAATQIVAKEESNGVISSITFVVGTGAIETDDTLVLLESTGNTLTAPATSVLVSPAFMLAKGAAAGSNVTVDWQIIDAANGNEITGGAVNPVTIATAYSGVDVKGFNGGKTTTDIINFAKDALEFTDGKTVVTAGVGFGASDKAATSGSFSNNLAFDFPKDDSDQPDTYAKATFKVTADVCDAIDTQDNNKAADDVKIGSTGLTASTTEACTWTSGLIDVSSDQDLSITVDGSTKLTNATWSYSADVALGTNDFATASVANIAKAYRTVTGTAFTFTSDVQGTGFELPYIYHIGTGSGYFSFVKVVNKNAKSTAANATNVVEMAFNAVISNTVTGEEFTVSNYKLGDIMNEGQFNFNGTDVIKALNEPKGTAANGFNETAMDLDTAENYHIALELIPRNSANTNFYVDVQNTAPAGRAQGTYERKQ